MANNPNAKANLKDFVKGDKRINRKGRPKDVPGLRELVQSILHEVATDKNGQPLEINGHTATVIEAKIRQLIQSRNTQDTRIVFDYAFGKVPDEIKHSGAVNVQMTWGDNDDGDGDSQTP